MKESSNQNSLDGKTIEFTYDGGWRFRIRFYGGLLAYELLGGSGENVSSGNADISYQSRSLGNDLIQVAWHETDVGDFVSLVIDLPGKDIYSAALLGYRESDSAMHFQHGSIHHVVDVGGAN